LQQGAVQQNAENTYQRGRESVEEIAQSLGRLMERQPGLTQRLSRLAQKTQRAKRLTQRQ